MLTLKIRPPQHAIDDKHVYIDPVDPAWDLVRIQAEKDRLVEAALALLPLTASETDKRKAKREAEAKHPVEVWYLARTRFSLEARILVPEKLRTGEHPESAVPITDYMIGDPTEFVIRPLSARAQNRLRPAMRSQDPNWTIEAAAFGLMAINQPDGSGPGALPRGSDGLVVESVIDDINNSDRLRLSQIGAAVYWLTQAMASGDQGKL